MSRLSVPTAPNTIEMNAHYVPEGYGRGGPSGTDAVQDVNLNARFATQEEAEAAAARFPKSCRIKVGTLHTYNDSGNLVLHTIFTRINLSADGANKGKNETGIKRYRSIVKAAAKAGITIEWLNLSGNGYATQADFENAL